MKQNILLPDTELAMRDGLQDPSRGREQADALIREMRHAAKRSKRAISGGWPMVILGMLLTIFVSSRYDIRLSLTIFAVVCGIVIAGLLQARYRWERLAERAVEQGDIRAIGPLVWAWSAGDDSAREPIEEALLVLLPNVTRPSQLSESARKGINRILTQEEGLYSRGQRIYNIDLVTAALETVLRIRDCRSLQGVRRLAAGYGPRHPVAKLRDLAQNMLPDLEERSALLRSASPLVETHDTLLRAALNGNSMNAAECLRASDAEIVPRTAGSTTADETEMGEVNTEAHTAEAVFRAAPSECRKSRRVPKCEAAEPVEVCSLAPFC